MPIIVDDQYFVFRHSFGLDQIIFTHLRGQGLDYLDMTLMHQDEIANVLRFIIRNFTFDPQTIEFSARLNHSKVYRLLVNFKSRPLDDLDEKYKKFKVRIEGKNVVLVQARVLIYRIDKMHYIRDHYPDNSIEYTLNLEPFETPDGPMSTLDLNLSYLRTLYTFFNGIYTKVKN